MRRTVAVARCLSRSGIAFSAVKNKPPYAIASVDSALLLATLLQQEGPMRVTDAAERLGVSVSTAHRLLGMLVYRDFAEQLPDRRYGPGRLMRHGPAPQAPVARLREVALPYLRGLVDELGETANLMVLAGADVRFVATVESDQVLRVGDRTGRALPAHLSSGGKAVLAARSAADGRRPGRPTWTTRRPVGWRASSGRSGAGGSRSTTRRPRPG